MTPNGQRCLARMDEMIEPTKMKSWNGLSRISAVLRSIRWGLLMFVETQDGDTRGVVCRDYWPAVGHALYESAHD